MGDHPALLSDSVAYGQLLGLLSEHPKQQQRVVAQVIEIRGEYVESHFELSQPITEREKKLVKRSVDVRDKKWKEALTVLTGEQRTMIEQRLLEMEL